MTNVIDRLRVQGNPAPRNLSSHSELRLRRSGVERDLPPDQQSVQFVLNTAHLQNRDTNSGRNVNPAARRLEQLQRIQQANLGLSTMDVRQPELHGMQFMLRGKPASAEVALINRMNGVQQRLLQVDASSSVGSGRSGRRMVRYSKAHSDTEGMPQRVRRPDLTAGGSAGAKTHVTLGEGTPTTLPSNLSTATSYFVLAHPNAMYSLPTRNDMGSIHPDTGGGGDNKGRGEGIVRQESSGSMSRRQASQLKSADSTTATLEMTGRHVRMGGLVVVTPRSTDGLSAREFYTRSPLNGRSRFKDNRSFKERSLRSPGLKDSLDTPSMDSQSLRQCLHVQPSSQPAPNHDTSAEAALKLKHFTQYIRTDAQSMRPSTKGKVNYNNPYRQSRQRDRGTALPESERRYIFDSVASYIHFNKIYPQLKNTSPGQNPSYKSSPLTAGLGGLTGGKEGLAKVPHMAGFPSHCTDTILLRMMFAMNRPGVVHGIGIGHQAAGAPSIRSTGSTKYSDVGRQKDLDEFMIQGETPSLTSARNSYLHHSQQQQQQQQQQQLSSQRSGGTVSYHAIPSPPKEEDEDEGDDADDEASQWNAKRRVGGGAGGEGVGGGGGGGGEGVDSELNTTLDSGRQQ